MPPRQAARSLRTNQTYAEHALWRQLRAGRLRGRKFYRQISIGRYVVDFVCFGAGLIVEVDGGQHTAQRQYDDRRTVWLQTQGFRVLRFWNNEVLQNMEAVKAVILETLTSMPAARRVGPRVQAKGMKSPPLPVPPPRRGERLRSPASGGRTFEGRMPSLQ